MTSLQQAGRLSSPRSRPVPAALVALSAIPLVAGTLRLVELAGGRRRARLKGLAATPAGALS
jgi:hypothetical protein